MERVATANWNWMFDKPQWRVPSAWGVRSLRWKQRDQCQGEKAPSHLRTLEDLDPQIMTGSSLHVLAASGHVRGAKSTTWSTRRTPAQQVKFGDITREKH